MAFKTNVNFRILPRDRFEQFLSTAEAAVDQAARLIYVPEHARQRALEMLHAGETAYLSYEFSDVQIRVIPD